MAFHRRKPKISDADVYTSVVQFIVHAENISWNRFNNFLVGNSILVAAWATLFDSAAKMALSTICAAGLFICFIWIVHGLNSRRYLDKYIEQGEQIEKRMALDEGPVISTCAIRDKIKAEPGWAGRFYRAGTSSFTLKVMPILFGVFYAVLLGATWWCDLAEWWNRVAMCF